MGESESGEVIGGAIIGGLGETGGEESRVGHLRCRIRRVVSGVSCTRTYWAGNDASEVNRVRHIRKSIR